MLWRKPPRDIAKVGVEGSNPFARSKFDLSGPDKTGRSVPKTWRQACGEGVDLGGIVWCRARSGVSSLN